MGAAQQAANTKLWARQDLVDRYAHRELTPAEVLLLVRHAEAFRGRVLELGCGPGRMTGHLVAIAEQVHAIDVNAAMLDRCRRTWPEAILEQRDLRDLSTYPPASFDVVIGPCNVLDVLDDVERRAVLDAIHGILAPGGLLTLCTHNLASAPHIKEGLDPLAALRKDGVLRAAIVLARLPRWWRNRRRMLPHERFEEGYAILNDISHDWAALHYYIARDAQERQLAEHGFTLVDCLDREGRDVGPGESAEASADLYYVARKDAPRHADG